MRKGVILRAIFFMNGLPTKPSLLHVLRCLSDFLLRLVPNRGLRSHVPTVYPIDIVLLVLASLQSRASLFVLLPNGLVSGFEQGFRGNRDLLPSTLPLATGSLDYSLA